MRLASRFILFVMNIKRWLKETRGDTRRQFVIDEAETTLAYLYQLAGSHRLGSPELHRRLHAASVKHTPDLVMALEHLRPDIWGAGFPTKARARSDGSRKRKQCQSQGCSSPEPV